MPTSLEEEARKRHGSVDDRVALGLPRGLSPGDDPRTRASGWGPTTVHV
jgi:hypothetical protein